MTKNPEKTSIKEFLENSIGTQFIIPVFQRNYIWKANKQVKKFIEDLFAVTDGKKTNHFIGIVIKKSSNIKIGLYEDLIIDGQQRIITVFLLTQAIKKIAKATNQDLITGLCDKILINDLFKSDEDYKYRLKPLIDDNQVYLKIANEDYNSFTDKEKNTNIYKNFIYIEKMLMQKYHQDDFAEVYNSLGNMYMVSITLDENDNSQEIFETLNSTGAALSKSDLIRNFLLMQYKDAKKQEKAYLQRWKPLQEEFTDANKFELFIRIFLAIKTYELIDIEDIYESYKKWFYDNFNYYTSVDAIIEELKDYSIYYNELYNGQIIITDIKYRDILQEFKKNTYEPAAPILVEIYALYKKQKIQLKTVIDCINLFVTYTTRRNICNLRTGALTRTAPSILREIIKDCSTSYDNLYTSLILNLVNKQIGKTTFMPDDTYLSNILQTENVYLLRTYLKPILDRIENHGSHVKVDVSMCSIDHLMPQTPTKEWMEYLNISEQDYEFHLNRLGNLTLVGAKDNSIMGNKPFDYKKKILNSTNHIKMNQSILSEKEWKIEQINNRTNLLISKICELYKYEIAEEKNQLQFDINYFEDNNKLNASIFEDYTVVLKPYSLITNPRFTQNFQQCIEEGIIISTNNCYKTIEELNFSSLEKLTDFVGLNTESCWEIWKNPDGDSLYITVKVLLDNHNRH